jgi:hypothetical protein
VVFSFVAVLIVGATVVIGRQASAGVDPCATVAPTLAPGTNTPAPTETLDARTVTPEPTNTEEIPTETNTAVPTDTPTEVPTDTATLVPTDTATMVPTDTPEPTATFPIINSVGNQFAGVNNSGNNRVLYQAVDCETPSPESTVDPVTELPNTGSGSQGESNTWILALVLMIAASAIAIRMRYVVRR